MDWLVNWTIRVVHRHWASSGSGQVHLWTIAPTLKPDVAQRRPGYFFAEVCCRVRICFVPLVAHMLGSDYIHSVSELVVCHPNSDVSLLLRYIRQIANAEGLHPLVPTKEGMQILIRLTLELLQVSGIHQRSWTDGYYIFYVSDRPKTSWNLETGVSRTENTTDGWSFATCRSWCVCASDTKSSAW